MRSLASNAPLAILAVSGVIALLVAHEVLAAIAGGSDRFAPARRRLFWSALAVGILVVVLIAARFYYLRAG